MTTGHPAERIMFMQSVFDLITILQQSSEIPKFDLAKQIMAEQRKITAIKRKGPDKMARPPQKQHPAESIGRNVMPRPILSGPGQIIAEIVARDIANLCIGNTSRL